MVNVHGKVTKNWMCWNSCNTYRINKDQLVNRMKSASIKVKLKMSDCPWTYQHKRILHSSSHFKWPYFNKMTIKIINKCLFPSLRCQTWWSSWTSAGPSRRSRRAGTWRWVGTSLLPWDPWAGEHLHSIWLEILTFDLNYSSGFYGLHLLQIYETLINSCCVCVLRPEA